uniref:Putative ovule protein n=1 Tax=Solanum chacoense TaxID=4108 RepID=A0A0V0GNJ4_SOLCH
MVGYSNYYPQKFIIVVRLLHRSTIILRSSDAIGARFILTSSQPNPNVLVGAIVVVLEMMMFMMIIEMNFVNQSQLLILMHHLLVHLLILQLILTFN